MNTLTFVLGRDHYHATRYIRKRVANGEPANRFRNITNPKTVKGLRSTENTTIEFVILDGAVYSDKYHEFRLELDMKKISQAGIIEIKDAL